MLNSIKRAGFRFRVGTSDPSRGTLVEPKYFQVLGLIWTTTPREEERLVLEMEAMDKELEELAAEEEKLTEELERQQ